MPRGRRSIPGPLHPLANNRRQFEKKHENIVQLIHKKLDDITTVSKYWKPVNAGANLRVELQEEPYERNGRWWGNYAVQIKSTVNGSLEVECEIPFPAGVIADAMIEACGNAYTTRLEGQQWVVTAYYQYVLWAREPPAGVSPA